MSCCLAPQKDSIEEEKEAKPVSQLLSHLKPPVSDNLSLIYR